MNKYLKTLLLGLVLACACCYGVEFNAKSYCDCNIPNHQAPGSTHPHKPDNFPNIYYENRIHCLQKLLPQYSAETIVGLMVNREGETKDSNMTALGVHKIIRKKQPYEITLDGFQEVEHANPINLEERLSLPLPPAPPPYVEIDAVWDKTPIESGDENNILGGNGLFLIDTAFINVPVVEASDETLAYYGGRIVQFGDVVEFPDDDFPIWAMNLGENYVKDFVMTQKGGGMYLEYHCDRPHFHMPLTDDARGYLILGKKTSVIDGELQKFKYHLTAFKIPFGKGVYTYKCTVHADPALIGTAWLVGYDNAKHYSTVLVREKDTNEKVTINFIEQ